MKRLDSEAYVDEGYLSVSVCNVTKHLYCFVMALQQPGGIFAYVSYDKGFSGFFKGHDEAFFHFGGVPRQIWYDSSSLVVRTRRGRATVQKRFEKYASVQGFMVRVAPLCRPMALAKTERVFGYVRYAAKRRKWSSIEELNQALKNRLLARDSGASAGSETTPCAPKDDREQANV